jgi:hypothetical protein
MKLSHRVALVSLLAVLALAAGCSSKKAEPPSDEAAFAADNLDGVVSNDLVVFDQAVSADGKGSLKIAVEQPTTIRLYEVPLPKVENSNMIYQAKVKAQDFGGDAYLQMLVHFPSGGEMEAQNYDKATGGTTDWVAMEVPFNVRKGQKPDVVRLNLILNGAGTVWVDDVRLHKIPQPE